MEGLDEEDGLLEAVMVLCSIWEREVVGNDKSCDARKQWTDGYMTLHSDCLKEACFGLV